MYPQHSAWATGLVKVLLRQGVFPETALAHIEKALELFQRGSQRITDGSQLGAILWAKGLALAARGHGVEAQKAIAAELRLIRPGAGEDSAPMLCHGRTK